MNEHFWQTVGTLIPQENILRDEKMDAHTTFRVGGPATCMLKIDTEEQLSKVIHFLHVTQRPYFILGNGSNLLVSDKGYDGVILKLSGEFEAISIEGNKVTCGAASLLSKVAKVAADNSLTGMEFASGIPGTLGGAMVMNAGAYDGEMKQITELVRVMNEDGEILKLRNESMEFGYRTSIIKGSKFIILSATLSLEKGDATKIKELMEDLNNRRRQKQPLEFPSAGSTFKRPEGYFAGKLIMDAGLRGFSIGGAKVSEKHCGFVINQGNASAADVYDVIVQVQETVKDKFGVKLEREVILLGDF